MEIKNYLYSSLLQYWFNMSKIKVIINSTQFYEFHDLIIITAYDVYSLFLIYKAYIKYVHGN
jgi:hypothetical protein